MRTLVLGGMRSGKSRYAQSLLGGSSDVCVVATGYPAEFDAEWAARVAAHRAARPAGWQTVETVDIVDVLRQSRTPVLIDCVPLWLTRMLDAAGWEGPVSAAVDGFVDAWSSAAVRVVAVSNEVGSGVIPATPAGRRFADLLGDLNQRLAAAADDVWLLVAGLPTRLK